MVKADFIIEKLCGKQPRACYKAGTLSKIDPVPGDTRYVFYRKNNQFTIEKLNHLLKWIIEKQYDWKIIPAGNATPTGFEHWVLMIGDQFARFRSDPSYSTLYLQLHSQQEVVLK